MNCSKNNPCELWFPIPRNGEKHDFIIFYHPDRGAQKQVIRCEAFQEKYNCINDHGFQWDKKNDTHGLITVPPHIAAESGKFVSQVPGKEEASLWSCLWSPVDNCSTFTTTNNSDAGYSTTPVVNGTLPTQSEHSGNGGNGTVSTQSENSGIGGNTALAVGLSVGLPVAIAIVIAIAVITVFKKRRPTRDKPCSKKTAMIEEGPKHDTLISDNEKAVDENKSKHSGVDPEQLRDELQHFLTTPSDKKKGHDNSSCPSTPTDTSGSSTDPDLGNCNQCNVSSTEYQSAEQQPSPESGCTTDTEEDVKDDLYLSGNTSSTESNTSQNPLLRYKAPPAAQRGHVKDTLQPTSKYK